MTRKTMFALAFGLALMSLLLIAGVAGKDEGLPESGEPFHIVLPVQPQNREGSRAIPPGVVELSDETGMTYVDDVSDMHDPGLDPEFNPAALHRQIRSETPDATWAPQSEDNLRSAIADSLFDRPAMDIRINCASSLCEARGLVREAQGSAEARSAIDLLQSGEMVNRLALNGQAFITISSAKRSNGTAFFLYSRRIR